MRPGALAGARGGTCRRVTVEVEPRRGRTVAASGRANRDPRPLESDLIARWASANGLTLADELAIG